MTGEDMMRSAFDGIDEHYVVLANDAEQRSIWPSYLLVPDGWQLVFGPANIEDCRTEVEQTWVDMRPRQIRTDSSANGSDAGRVSRQQGDAVEP